MNNQLKVTSGRPYPLGASYVGRNLNLAVRMHPQKEGGVLLYDKKDRSQIVKIPFRKENQVGEIFCIAFKDAIERKYDYLFYEDESMFVDPYAKRVIGNEVWRGAAEMEGAVPLFGCFLQEAFPYEDDKNPLISYADSFIYCIHVRGFTRHPSSKVRGKGTFRGIMEKIPYLKELGVTAVELMPAYEFLEDSCEEDAIYGRCDKTNESMEYARKHYKRPESEKTGKKSFNYWGYQEGYYYAPKASYAYSDNPVTEFQKLVYELHKNGMELIMQFYFPDGIQAGNILQILRYWVFQYHVDGFRLKGTSVPFYLIAKDPMFTRTKLMYDDVPENILYPDHVKPEFVHIAYCSDEFSTLMRRYLKGDNNCLSQFQMLNRTVPSCIGTICSITNYYGFRLQDLVSFEQKHNEANGEENKDGVAMNYSWNCGVEGKTRKKSVLQLRRKQMKNAMCLLFLAQGTPFLMSGDEFGQTQNGNNNPYNQDNETSWLNWNWNANQKKFLEFSKKLIRFRKENSAFHKQGCFSPVDIYQCGYPEISCHTEELWKADYSEWRHHVGVLYVDELPANNNLVVACKQEQKETIPVSKENWKGRKNRKKQKQKAAFPEENKNLQFTYVLYNMHWNEHRFALPKLPVGYVWTMVFDTSDDERKLQTELETDIQSIEVEEKDNDQKTSSFVMVNERSIMVLIARKEQENHV